MTTTNKLIPGTLFLVNDTTGEFFGLRINDREIAIPSSAPAPSGGYVGLTLLAANGTAAAPSYSFSTETNTGLYLASAGFAVGATGGLDRFFFGLSNTANLHAKDALGFFTGSFSAPDLVLIRDVANTLAQRNGTAAQAFRLYNTFTDASNYERGVFDWVTSPGALTVGTAAAGTGAVRNILLKASGTFVLCDNNFAPNAAGSFDLGLSAQGWKRLYVDYTNTATVGAVTINKATGRVNIAAAATSIVVTNSLVTAATKVFAVPVQADANNPLLRSVVPAAGSFTITVSAAPAANQAWDFFIVNTD